MGHYKSNLRDIEFNLFELLGRTRSWARGPFAEARPGNRPRDPGRGRAAGRRPGRRVVRRRPTGTRRSSTRPRTRSGCRPGSRRRSRRFMDAEWFRLELPAELGGTTVPRSLNWSVAELILGANPAVWMYASGASFARALCQLGTPEQQRVRPARGRAAVDRDDGADRAGRRLGRRRRADQGDRAAGRHLAHRGRQAVHHQRRARHGGEHLPPGAGPARGARPGHQGAVHVPGAQVPARRPDGTPGERNGVYATERRAQDGPEGLDHLRADLRRAGTRRSARWSATCTTASGRCS